MAILTFYISKILGERVKFSHQKATGKLQDLIVDVGQIRPQVVAAKVRFGGQSLLMDFSHFSVNRTDKGYEILCERIEEAHFRDKDTASISKNILDQQIVDIDGRKVVRVNDLRMAFLSTGLFIIAVDVGLDGLLRRLALEDICEKAVGLFGGSIPGNLILWDDVAAISVSNKGIQLSKSHEKLSTLHPSDLADILEDLDRNTLVKVFSSLDEKSAADVLEEMESEAQIDVIESLSVEKAADVLEMMPADEVADILEDLDSEKAEELLSEMEDETSQEVRELMEYAENTVGSLMTTDYVSLHESMTVDETINELRRIQPRSDTIYYLYVLDAEEKLVASLSLRDLITAQASTRLSEIMDSRVIKVLDTDPIDSLADTIAKYNLIAIPVVDKDDYMMGMVIIDDIITALLKNRRRASLRAE